MSSTRSRCRRLLINGALVFAGVTVALLLVEVFLRVFHPIELRIRGNRIVLPVNRRYTVRNPQVAQLDSVVTYSKNTLGFRGPELPTDHKSFLKVITIGGSTTEDTNLSDDRTWSHHLGERLQRSFDRLWLNNAGMSGLSSNGQLILLQDYIVSLRPDIALFLVGINDMGMRGRPSDQWITGQRDRWWETLLYRSEFAYLSVQLYRYMRGSAFVRAHTIYTVRSAPQFTGTIDADAVRTEFTSYLWPYRERLAAHVRIAREHGIEPAFMTQPAIYGDGVDDVTGSSLGTVDVWGMPGWLAWEVLERYNGVTREVARANGVLLIDLARALPKSSRYFYDLIHYSNEGAAEVARIIGDQLCPFMAERYPARLIRPCGAVAAPPSISN